MPLWVAGLLALGLVAAVVSAVGIAAGWGSDPIERRVDELRAAEAVRDREQIEELTAQAREVRDQIVPSLEELEAALPTGDEPATAVADPAQVEAWQEAMTGAAEAFESAPSGTTATNIARHSLGAAVGLLGSAVDLYAIAIDVDGAVQEELIERASDQHILAIQTWSVGATQLDAINIDAGFGHQHVYLEVEGDHGAMTPDGFEDGDEAHDH